MVQKKSGDEEFDLDNFDFEDFEIDIPEFDDPDPTNDDRKPVEKLAAGFKQGFASNIASPELIKRSLGQALPRGYAQAINVYDATSETARELYNSVAKDLAPIADSARLATAKLSPKIKAKLPKSLQEKLENFAAGGEYTNYSAKKLKQESEDSQITGAIQELFQQQADRENEILARDQADETIKEAIGKRRHEESIDQMSVVAKGVSRLVGYQDSILSKYQQKSLELQFRHYFVAKDMLELSTVNSDKTIAALDKLVKNTALPEAVKIQQSELAGQMLKEKMISNTFGNIANWTRDYRENLTKNIGDYVGGVMSGIGMLGGASAVTDSMGGAQGAGFLAGNAAADMAHDAIATRLAPYLDKMPGVRKFGAKMGNVLTSAPKRLNKWAKSETEGFGFKATFTQFIKDILPKYHLDDNIKTAGVLDSDRPATFDNLTHRSIVEIIPGWLSQINRWVKATATGKLDTEDEMDVYNLEQSRFTSRSTYLDDMKKRLLPKNEVDALRTSIDDMMNELVKPGDLSPDAWRALRRKLLTDLAKGEDFDPVDLTKREFYKDVDPEYIDELRYFFRNTFFVGMDGYQDDSVELHDRVGALKSKFNSLESMLPNTADYVRNLYDIYGRENVERLGLASRQGQFERINHDKIFDLYLEDQDIPSKPGNDVFGGNQIGPLPVPPAPRQELTAPAPQQSVDLSTAVIDRLEQYLGRDSVLIQEILGLRSDVKANNISELIAITNATATEISLKMDRLATGGVPGTQEAADQIKRKSGLIRGLIGGAGTATKGYAKAVLGFYKGAGKAAWLTTKGAFGMARDAAPGVLGAAWSTGKEVASLAGSYLKGVGTLYKGMGTAAMTTGRGLFDTAKGMGKGFLGNLTGYKETLLAKALKTGEYFDSETGKRIRQIKELKGKLLDKYGKPVDIDSLVEQGESLLGHAGEKIGGAAGSLTKFAGRMGLKGAELYGKALMLPFKAMAWGFKKTRGLLARGKKPSVSFQMSGNAENDLITLNYHQLTIQEQLLDIIKKRFGSKAAGDADGDGDRDGSWRDLLFKRKAKKDEDGKAAEAAEAKRGKSLWGGLGSMLSGTLGKFLGKKKEEDAEKEETLADKVSSRVEDYLGDKAEGWIDDKLGGGDDSAGPNDRTGRRRGRGGRLRRFGNMAKNGLKVGGKLLGLGGAAYGAYNAYQNLQEGNYGSAALDAGLSLGGVAMMGGGGMLASAGSAILGGLGAAATAIGGIVSAPVLLGGAAIAALGYGGYKLYRHVADTPTPLRGMRYAQYGIDPRDAEQIAAVDALEKIMSRGIQYDDEGKAKVLSSGNMATEVTAPFGIDLSNPSHEERAVLFTRWLQKRFMPVYLANMTALNKLSKNTKLEEVDEKLPVAQGLDYIKITRLDELAANYDDLESTPFEDELDSDADDVEDWVDDAIEHYEEAMEDAPEPTKTSSSTPSTKEAAAATTVAAGAAKTLTANTGKGATDTEGLFSGFGDKALSVAKSFGAGVATGLGLTAFAAAWAFGGMDTIKSITGKLTTSKKKPSVTLDALTAARYKIYGLVDLDLDKVDALYNLEDVMWKGVKYDNKQAYYDGTSDDIYPVVKEMFGVDDKDEKHRASWFMWYRSRFLPVFTQFCTSVRQIQSINAKDASDKLTLDEQHEVLVQISTTQTFYEGRSISVWEVTESPWKDYSLNDDVTTIAENIEALKTAGKRAGYKERSQRVADAKTEIEMARRQESIDKEGNYAGGTTPGEDEEQGFWSKTMDKIFGAKDQTGSRTGGFFGESIDPNKDLTNGTSGPLTGGSVIQQHPGGGTGGDVNTIPVPKGAGWSNARETFLAAAKMTGFDPHIAATVAAVESSFDPNAKAPTSSAGGYFQFLDATWKETLDKHGAKYGLAKNASKYDGRANALMGMEFLKDNAEYLKKRLGREITDVDLYAAHFLGPGGAAKFLGAPTGSDARGWVGENVPGANYSIFFDKNGTARTVGGVYEEFDRRLTSRRKMHDIPAGYKLDQVKVDANGNVIEAGEESAPSSIPMSDPEARAKADAAAAASGWSDDVKLNAAGEPTSGEPTPTEPVSSGTNTKAAIIAGQQAAEASGIQPTSGSDLPAPAPLATAPSPEVQMGQATVAQTQSSAETGELSKSISSVSDILARQLGVQQSIDNRLLEIHNLLVRNGGKPSAPTQPTPVVPKQKVTQTTNGLSKTPVDVSRQKA